MYHHVYNFFPSDIDFYGHFFRNDKNKYWLAACRRYCLVIICVLYLKKFEYRTKLHIEMKNCTVACAIAFKKKIKTHKYQVKAFVSYRFFSVFELYSLDSSEDVWGRVWRPSYYSELTLTKCVFFSQLFLFCRYQLYTFVLDAINRVYKMCYCLIRRFLNVIS